jgi:hypothetical protein
MRMGTGSAGNWRDERELPITELTEAMATYSADGQADDLTGNDAGAAAEADGPDAPGDDPDRVSEDPDSEEGRRWRPSPDGPGPAGRSGPH